MVGPIFPAFGAGPFHVSTRDEQFLGDLFGAGAIAVKNPGPPVARDEDGGFSGDVYSEPINVFCFHMGEILAGGYAIGWQVSLVGGLDTVTEG
jgi:hypothetical protein